MSEAIELIAAERQRQIGDEEGYHLGHDDGYRKGELSQAAIAYAGISYPWYWRVRGIWPWPESGFKPDNNRTVRNLVKAGALIVAEIERLQRLAAGGE